MPRTLAVFVLTLLVLLASPMGARAAALSPEDMETYRTAFRAVKDHRWEEALSRAGAARDPLPRKVIAWTWYTRRGNDASFAEIADFRRDNPDWPLPWLLQQRAEEAIKVSTPPAQLLSWYRAIDARPRTSDGALALGQALLKAGRDAEAADLARHAWVAHNYGRRQQSSFLRHFGRYLEREHHIERLDRLLWDGLRTSSTRMFHLVGPGWKALARARVLLRHDLGGVDAAIARVPARLADHPGLVFERVSWRRRHGHEQRAIDLLLDHPGDKGDAERWWRERAWLARWALDEGEPALAYRIVSEHGQSAGAPLAEAE